MGDPRGVGPEVIVKALREPDLADARLLVIGSLPVLRQAAAALSVELDVREVAEPDWRSAGPAILNLDNFPLEELDPRAPGASSGRAALDYIVRAVGLAMNEAVGGIVTGPISKEAIAEAGSPFPDHTEMLAHLCGVPRVAMLLVSARLKVALATTHVALQDVAAAVRTEDIVETLCILDEGLRRFFGVSAPRIAVCALNPHCGDGGRFGDEEARVLMPAVERVRRAGLDVQGPRPADTVFLEARRGDYDVVLALYHDQGMIPVKLDGLASVVNVTLGLPFVRTSVGHGTAFDIAGRGVADHRSLAEAIRLAAAMARQSG